MKDNYVGDVNDYLKYGFLQWLKDSWTGPLIVCWMLTQNDEQGTRTGYLDGREWWQREGRDLDPVLFDRLAKIVGADNRSVQAIEGAGILDGASFFKRRLDPNSRDAFFRELWESAREPSLIFFDPDTGLASPSARKKQTKHLFPDELAEAGRRGHSIVVYQHHQRRDWESTASWLRDEADQHLPEHHALTLYPAFPITPKPTAAFLLLAAGSEAKRLVDAALAFAERWPVKID